MLYNKVLGGLEDKVVILEVGEDNNLWLNNTEVLQGTCIIIAPVILTACLRVWYTKYAFTRSMH